MSATLGGLIRDLRNQKNISQLEVAFALGWKEPSRLSRIEQGKVDKPSRELLDSLMEAMRLNTEEKNRLYTSGSYLPTKEDIAEAKNKLKPFVDSWPYPASSFDFSWRIIYSNQKMYQLYGLGKKEQQQIEVSLPNVLEITFNPDYEGHQEDDEFYLRVLNQFQYDQKTRTHERWYLDLVKRMMENDTFRRLWPKAMQNNTSSYDVFNFAYKKIKGMGLYAFNLSVLNDPRFIIEYYTPADAKTFQYFDKEVK